DAVHGRSNAKRKTFRVATSTAEPQTSHGRTNTAAYSGANGLDFTERLASAEAPLRLPRLSQGSPQRRHPVGSHGSHNARLSRGTASARTPTMSSRAGRGGRIRRGAHDGVAEALPRRHAAGDVEPVRKAVPLERADGRARAQASRAEHGLGPVG